jgi:hypothetical protein
MCGCQVLKLSPTAFAGVTTCLSAESSTEFVSAMGAMVVAQSAQPFRVDRPANEED